MSAQKPPRPAGLDALREVRAQVPKAAVTPRPGRRTLLVRTPESTEPDLDFGAAMRDVAPIATPNRAEIGRAKPAPVPRPKAAEPADEATSSHRKPRDQSDAGMLAAAMEDVVPMAPTGRVDPGLLNKPKTKTKIAASPLAGEDMTAWLDAAPLPDDPSALFQHAVGNAQALKDSGRVEIARAAPAPLPRQRDADDAQVLHESIEAPLSFEDRLDIGDEAAFLRVGIPRRVLTDLRRGRWVVQAELDLHGLTRDEARSELGQFLAQRLARGERCVRVIHGKGLGSPGRIGVLRQLSRNWLAQREEILAFCQAKPHDGGDGAVLVLLRAPRPA
ncbi:Smr/MutS family protein [Niveibacterium sp. SC-1]|uniref:Smr/MutS family protein n=1 Tax=Niveibacterium sp. SC-1 TaxID=3135646 RepID=UPI00311DF675